MRISTIATYPIKGCHRLEHETAEIEPWGLAGDRRWMIVDPAGVGITQRETALLTQLHVSFVPGGIQLTAPDMRELSVDFPRDGDKIDVRVFKSKDPVPARIAESAWVSRFLGREAILTWQEDPTGRTIEEMALPEDRVSFADGYPLLLANTGSLDALNDWLAEAGEDPVPMTRFRPNLVVTGAPAWAEDDWIGRRLLIGDVPFRAAKSCARCVVTTIDQETGAKTRQPLRLLGKRRNLDGGLLFAINLIPDVPQGTVRIGDPVSVPPSLGES